MYQVTLIRSMLLSSDIEKCTNQQDLSLKYFVAHMNSLYYQQHN